MSDNGDFPGGVALTDHSEDFPHPLPGIFHRLAARWGMLMRIEAIPFQMLRIAARFDLFAGQSFPIAEHQFA